MCVAFITRHCLKFFYLEFGTWQGIGFRNGLVRPSQSAHFKVPSRSVLHNSASHSQVTTNEARCALELTRESGIALTSQLLPQNTLYFIKTESVGTVIKMQLRRFRRSLTLRQEMLGCICLPTNGLKALSANFQTRHCLRTSKRFTWLLKNCNQK